MPFALPLLGDAVFAILVVLMAIAAAVLVRALASNVDPLPWPIGALLAHAINAAASKVQGWFVSTNKAVFSRVSNLIRAHWYLAFGAVGAILEALAHHASQIASLNNTTIPGAMSSAESAAHSYTDGQVKGVQDSLNGAISDEAHDVRSLQSNIDALHNYVTGPFQTAVQNYADADTAAAERLAHSELASAEADIVQRLSGDEAIISNLTQLATVTIPQEIRDAVATEAAARSASIAATAANLQSELNGLQTQITQQAAAQQAALASAVQAINTQQAQDLTTSEGYAAAQAAAAEAQAQTEVAQQAAAQQAALASQAASVSLQLSNLQGQVTIEQANTGVLQQVTSIAIPASIAAVAAVATATATEVAECMVTTCDGPNNWQNLLQDALGVASFAEIAAFLAQAVKDPQGEAAALASVGSDIYSGGHALLDSLLSL